jgi:hypothetical protein
MKSTRVLRIESMTIPTLWLGFLHQRQEKDGRHVWALIVAGGAGCEAPGFETNPSCRNKGNLVRLSIHLKL